MILHFDGDILVYRAGFAAEKMWYTVTPKLGGEGLRFQYKKDVDNWLEANGLAAMDVVIDAEREAEDVGNALYNVKSIISKVVDDLEMGDDDSTVVYLSGPTNFRDGVATIKKYKGNRDDLHKPVHAPAIKEFIDSRYNTVWSEDEEADDVIGYSHYECYLEDPYSSIICSLDKDLDMIPGLHYNFVREEAYFVNEDAALQCFYKQLLMGDPTDNIPGCPSIGPKKAEAALAECADEDAMYAAARALYVQGYGEDMADAALLENARLLWIRRKPGEWWNPPTEKE